CHQGNSFPLTF
nr:immunoglobulin light chain junction region [Macaca mulatta]MOV62719.1 immunoglobulin light chain junction region [Macaca mulatta]